MWRRGMAALACAALIAVCPGCACPMKGGPGNGCLAAASLEKQMTVEEMTQEAQARYTRAVDAGRTKEQAADEAASFLRGQKKVAEVKVLGNDSLRVVFTDGGDLVMLLGRDRL